MYNTKYKKNNFLLIRFLKIIHLEWETEESNKIIKRSPASSIKTIVTITIKKRRKKLGKTILLIIIKGALLCKEEKNKKTHFFIFSDKLKNHKWKGGNPNFNKKNKIKMCLLKESTETSLPKRKRDWIKKYFKDKDEESKTEKIQERNSNRRIIKIISCWPKKNNKVTTYKYVNNNIIQIAYK